ncbi:MULTISPECIES: hypothetical protein [Streptomyces]|nr:MULTISPECIES: hypothetical protein [Streptomyces]WST57361.1 hypothetical protein OG475_32835 [Streptomyces rubiginosohelvolus]
MAVAQIAVMVSRSPGVSLVSAGAVAAGPLSAAHLASGQFFSALVWADRQVGWIEVVEESQRNNLLPVGVTTAVLGGVYLAWVLFKRRGAGTACRRSPRPEGVRWRLGVPGTSRRIR